MERDRPFRTIGVIDNRTGKACKVACMSCIRGHRTTACGGNVCRSKVLWTCKRPGRPSSTCTCPHGRTGQCRCVVARIACPHKPSKGSRRWVDCRCDEAGRWCCMLDAQQWEALVAKQRPRVDFYPSLEAMNATNPTSAASTALLPPPPPERPSQTIVALPSTPQRSIFDDSQLTNFHPPEYRVPRFGMMGVGLPMGSEGHQGEDVFNWQETAPPPPLAPQPFIDFSTRVPTSLNNSTMLAANQQPFIDFSTPNSTSFNNPLMLPPNPATLHNIAGLSQASLPSSSYMPDIQPPDRFLTPGALLDPTNTAPQQPAQAEQDKWMEDYLNFQFPFAICQNCGLSGCTCRRCPAVMQNSTDGTWAQFCSRQHISPAVQIAPTLVQTAPPSMANPTSVRGSNAAIGPRSGINDFTTLSEDQLFPTGWNGFGVLPDGGELNFSDFVVTDPDPPDHGCCRGGER